MSAAGAERMGPDQHELPPSAAAPAPACRFEPEDDSEWEYEYSTTETETYYLTVDLSLPEFVDRNPSGVMHFGRGGYYADWINDPESEHKRSMAHRVERPGGNINEDEDEDEDDESLPEREDDDEEEPDLDRYGPPRVRDGDTEVVDDKLVARDIEILDLHTDHPIISYRGKVFEGSWAEVLGTEMIFAAAGDDSAPQLPALRSLPGGVDLLAASSARILTTEKVLTIPEELERLRAAREAYGVSLPVLGKHRIDERKRQVRFLENLTALKMKKGERDQVTVMAKPAADKNFPDDRDPNFMPRRAKPKFASRGPGLPTSEGGLGTRGRKPLSGRGPAGLPAGGVVQAVRPRSDVHEAAGSVPTPGAWSDILTDEEGDEEDEEGEEDYGEEGAEDEREVEDYGESSGSGGDSNEDDDGDVVMGGSP